MVVRREKKSKSLRGWRTHGWGRVGQHRRSGTRGGRGHAGYHKHYWTWVVRYAPDWYGKHGFTRHPSIIPRPRCINVGQLDESLDEWVREGKAALKEGVYEVDVTKLGYTRLLGSGKITKRVIVRVVDATERAVEKVRQAGGDVILVRGGE
ncbi:MAG: 50S ribosomal protein L15 [Thermoprotei archaeon]|nr:MAG: 50S ribosomal protein L15 [Thermoprotei archaeon]